MAEFDLRIKGGTIVDVFGQKWNLQFAITPVIPKLMKGNLFWD